MLKLFKFGLGMVGVLWMFIAGGLGVWWWDHRPAGVPKPIEVRVLFWPVKIGWPESLAAKLADRDRQLGVAVANERTLTRALNNQSGRVRALGAAGAVLKAQAALAATDYRKALARASASEAVILAAGSGPGDAEQRAEAVDRTFLGSLRR